MVDPKVVKEMCRLKDEEGWTYQMIADKYGTTRQTVHARLNYYGTNKYNAKKLAEKRRREGNQDAKAN